MHRDIQCKFTKLCCPRNTNSWKLPDLVRRLDKSKTCLPQTQTLAFPLFSLDILGKYQGGFGLTQLDASHRECEPTEWLLRASLLLSLPHCPTPWICIGPDPSSWPCHRRKYLDSSPLWNFCSCSNYCSCFVLTLPADPLTRTSELQKKIRYGSESTVGGA